jgi:hypothetical protein
MGSMGSIRGGDEGKKNKTRQDKTKQSKKPRDN